MHAVRKQRNALRAILALQLLQPRCQKIQRLVPSGPPELAFAALTQYESADTSAGRGHTTVLYQHCHERTTFPLLADDVDFLATSGPAVGHFGHHPAAPETHLAVGRDLLNAGVAPPAGWMHLGSERSVPRRPALPSQPRPCRNLRRDSFSGAFVRILVVLAHAASLLIALRNLLRLSALQLGRLLAEAAGAILRPAPAACLRRYDLYRD